MIKSFPLEDSYLLQDDLFGHPISYVMGCFTFLIFVIFL